MESPTYGKITQEEMLDKIFSFVTKKDLKYAQYEISVGTDSQCSKKGTKIVLVVAVHELGHGGIYFYETIYNKKKYDISKKIHTEVQMSIEMAEVICLKMLEWKLPNVIFNHIDVDIGINGVTKKYIKEIRGWIQGVLGSYGINAHIKPNSPTASCIADRLSK